MPIFQLDFAFWCLVWPRVFGVLYALCHSCANSSWMNNWCTWPHFLWIFSSSCFEGLLTQTSDCCCSWVCVSVKRYLTERLSLGNVISSGNHHWIAIKLTKLIMHGFITTLSPNSIYSKVTSAKVESPCHQRVSQQVCAGPVFFTLSHEFWPLSSLLSFIFLVLLSSPCSG